MNRRRQRHRARMMMRHVRPRRRAGTPPRTYRVISFSAPLALCDFLDRTTALLREAGLRRANRSMVVQTAIEEFLEA